jgi:hypothetical protein
MKLIVLLTVVVASAVADSAVPNLRSASTAAATDMEADPVSRQLSYTAKTYDNDEYDVERGEPSYLEFYNYRGYCVGFDRERKGEKAKVVDCDDTDAAYVAYRSDDLLELYNTDLCLEADGSYLRLYECDPHDDEQRCTSLRKRSTASAGIESATNTTITASNERGTTSTWRSLTARTRTSCSSLTRTSSTQSKSTGDAQKRFTCIR